MHTRTNSLLVFVYSSIALVIALLVFLLGTQYQKTEQLVAELNETERQVERRQVAKPVTQPRRSMRPALMRLENLLEERTQMVRAKQDELSEQISGREKLKQKYEKLSKTHEALRNEHELLLNEIEFYLSAVDVAAVNEPQLDGTDRLAANPEEETADGIAATEQLPEAELTELSDLELERLRQELEELTESSQRDSIVAGYASQAVVEMGSSAVPLLTAMLVDNQADARAWAAWVLGEIGSEASVAIPDLEQLLNDGNADVVDAATEAIRRIDD